MGYAQNLYLWPHLSLLAAGGDERAVQEFVRQMTDEQRADLLHDALTSQALLLRDVQGAEEWCVRSRSMWATTLHGFALPLPAAPRPLRSV